MRDWNLSLNSWVHWENECDGTEDPMEQSEGSA